MRGEERERGGGGGNRQADRQGGKEGRGGRNRDRQGETARDGIKPNA